MSLMKLGVVGYAHPAPSKQEGQDHSLRTVLKGKKGSFPPQSSPHSPAPTHHKLLKAIPHSCLVT